jgi:hypothetical protein
MQRVGRKYDRRSKSVTAFGTENRRGTGCDIARHKPPAVLVIVLQASRGQRIGQVLQQIARNHRALTEDWSRAGRDET